MATVKHFPFHFGECGNLKGESVVYSLGLGLSIDGALGILSSNHGISAPLALKNLIN